MYCESVASSRPAPFEPHSSAESVSWFVPKSCSLAQAVLLIAGGIVGSANAEVAVVAGDESSDAPIVMLSGEVNEADVNAIAEFDHVLSLMLNSEGGSVRAAVQIGRIVRDRGWMTWVSPEGQCLSSCALIYIAGVKRQNDGVVGLHRPYLIGDPLSADEVESAVRSMYSDVRAYVERMGVTAEFTEIMMNTPPESMRVFVGEDIDGLVPERDPLADELRVAHAARDHGVSTEEYRRREVQADEMCGPMVDAAGGIDRTSVNCRDAILWGLSVSVYIERSKQVRSSCELSEEETEAVVSWGERKLDHPAHRRWQRCQLSIMRGRAPPEQSGRSGDVVVEVEPILESLFGSTRDEVLTLLESRGIEPYAVEPDAIWFLGERRGVPLNIAYTFDSENRMDGAIWLFDDASQETFDLVEDVLSGYGELINVTTGGVVEYERVADEMKTLHVLDSADNSHTVYFNQRD